MSTEYCTITFPIPLTKKVDDILEDLNDNTDFWVSIQDSGNSDKYHTKFWVEIETGDANAVISFLYDQLIPEGLSGKVYFTGSSDEVDYYVGSYEPSEGFAFCSTEPLKGLGFEELQSVLAFADLVKEHGPVDVPELYRLLKDAVAKGFYEAEMRSGSEDGSECLQCRSYDIHKLVTSIADKFGQFFCR